MMDQRPHTIYQSMQIHAFPLTKGAIRVHEFMLEFKTLTGLLACFSTNTKGGDNDKNKEQQEQKEKPKKQEQTGQTKKDQPQKQGIRKGKSSRD